MALKTFINNDHKYKSFKRLSFGFDVVDIEQYIKKAWALSVNSSAEFDQNVIFPSPN